MPKRKYVHDLWGRQLYGNRGIAVHRNVHTKQLIDPYTKPKKIFQNRKINLQKHT